MNMLDKLAKMPVPLRGLRTMARVTCPRCAALRNLQRGALSATVTISPASGHFQRSNLSAIGTPRTFAVTSWSQFRASAISRSPELEDEIAKITDLYGDAKDELEYAVESRGTVYYNDDKKGASEVRNPAAISPHLLADRWIG